MAKPKTTVAQLKNPNPNLYQLTVEAQQLAAILFQTGGELTPEIEAALSANEAALAAKVDGYVYIEGQFELQAELLKRKEEGLRKIRKALEGGQEYLRNNIKKALMALNLTQIGQGEYRYCLEGGGTKLVIDDEKAIPDDFRITVVIKNLDKDKLEQALKAGMEVPGARLEDVKRLRFRENEGKE